MKVTTFVNISLTVDLGRTWYTQVWDTDVFSSKLSALYSALSRLEPHVRVVIGHRTILFYLVSNTTKCLFSGFVTFADRKQASLTLTRPTEFPKYYFWW